VPQQPAVPAPKYQRSRCCCGVLGALSDGEVQIGAAEQLLAGVFVCREQADLVGHSLLNEAVEVGDFGGVLVVSSVVGIAKALEKELQDRVANLLKLRDLGGL
jgi:hypothetical protein